MPRRHRPRSVSHPMAPARRQSVQNDAGVGPASTRVPEDCHRPQSVVRDDAGARPAAVFCLVRHCEARRAVAVFRLLRHCEARRAVAVLCFSVFARVSEDCRSRFAASRNRRCPFQGISSPTRPTANASFGTPYAFRKARPSAVRSRPLSSRPSYTTVRRSGGTEPYSTDTRAEISQKLGRFREAKQTSEIGDRTVRLAIHRLRPCVRI